MIRTAGFKLGEQSGSLKSPTTFSPTYITGESARCLEGEQMAAQLPVK
jgi:hypothetical protein